MLNKSEGGPELAFTFAHGQNRFFFELAEALVYELKRIGVVATINVGSPPPPRKGLVHVFLPPHEYVALSSYQPTAKLLTRSILISAEQPGSSFFAANVALARNAGAVFDINPRSVRAYEVEGITAAHLPLGYTQLWDWHEAKRDRDIDILFLGRLTPRRARALACYADVFEGLRCHLVLSDNSRPNTGTGACFVAGDEKRALLSRAKIVLNVHGEDEPYFEWLRVVEAICAGCAVVSEHSTDFAPLECGRHVVTGRLGSLGLLCAWLAQDEQRRKHIASEAYELLHGMPLVESAHALVSAARKVDGAPVERIAELTARQEIARGEDDYEMHDKLQPPQRVGISDGEAVALRTLKNQQLTIAGLRRRLENIELAVKTAGHGQPATTTIIESPMWRETDTRKITVITPLYNHCNEIVRALNSLERSARRDWEAVIVDDGSTDGGAEAVTSWIEAHPYLACCLVRHATNRGLAAARNTGVSHARTERLLMLDADNELRRIAMDRLMEALDEDPNASFAWGIMEQFSVDGPVGLLSTYGWDPQRFRAGNYIDAFALIRLDAITALGGYSSDSRLYGWEDYDLWVRMAESGRHGVFVPEIIARYRVGASSMISHTNVSAVDAFAAISDHAPHLMTELQLPR